MRYKDFRFECTPIPYRKRDWKEYYKYKNRKTPLVGWDREWMKMVRRNFRSENWAVKVTHKPTGTSLYSEYGAGPISRKYRLRLIESLLGMIRDNRRCRQRVGKTTKRFAGVAYQTTGGCFTVTKSINSLAAHPDWHNPLLPKVPRSKYVNYIGVELEFLANAGGPRVDDIAKALKKAGYGRYANVGTDPSCGYEVRCLLPEDNWTVLLTGILATLKGMGFKCDERCGTHVHLDMRNRDIAKVYKNMFFTQTFLRKFLTKERKRNKYCMRNTKAEYDPMERVRYMGINVQSYTKHKTLEVRMHHGTLEMDELGPWISLLLKVINFNSEINKRVLTLKQASSIFNIDEQLATQLKSRLNVLFKKPPAAPAQPVQPEMRFRTTAEFLRQMYGDQPPRTAAYEGLMTMINVPSIPTDAWVISTTINASTEESN